MGARSGWVTQNFAFFFPSPAPIFVARQIFSLSGDLLVSFLSLSLVVFSCLFSISKIPRENKNNEHGSGTGNKKREILACPVEGGHQGERAVIWTTRNTHHTHRTHTPHRATHTQHTHTHQHTHTPTHQHTNTRAKLGLGLTRSGPNSVWA